MSHYGSSPFLARMLLSCGVALFQGLPAYGETDPIVAGEVLTLPQAVALALQQNPTMRTAAARVQGARARIGAARGGMLPQIGIGVNGTSATPFGVPAAPTGPADRSQFV